MKSLSPGRTSFVAGPFLLTLAVTNIAKAQPAWVEPSLAPVPASVAGFPQREGLKRLQAGDEVRGTLATISNGILALRPLPEATNPITGGLTKAYFVPLTLGAGERAYGPRILPDGSAVLFRVAGESGAFHLYKFSLKEKTLTRLTAKPLTFDRVELSPDGRQAAILRGVDATGAAQTPNSGQLMLLDLASGKESVAAKTDAAGWGGWAFLNPTQLVFTAQPVGDAFPLLYSVSTKPGEAPKLLAKTAWRPLPNADGTKVAFYGAQDPTAADDGLKLSARWDQNPRGAYVSVVATDGTGRKALWHQDGAYALLAWNGDGLITIKNRRWTTDMGEHRLDRYDATRIDDYRGGLFGTLSLDGDWKWIALLKSDMIADYQIYQVYPNTSYDVDFNSLGVSGDGKRAYFITRATQNSKDGNKITDTLWYSHDGRQFTEIAELEGDDGIDFHDESGPAPHPSGLNELIRGNPQGEAIVAAQRQTAQVNQILSVDAGIKALKATLPDGKTTRDAAYALLGTKAGVPMPAPGPQDDITAWSAARFAEIQPTQDKQQVKKNGYLSIGEALRLADADLASNDPTLRQKGYDLAKGLAQNRLAWGESDLLRLDLEGWVFPNIELGQANAQLMPTLNNLVQGTTLEPAVSVAVLQLRLAADIPGSPIADPQLRLAVALTAAKRFDEASATLDLITDPAFADRVTKQRAAIVAAKAAG